jgi:serine protease Do
MEGRRNRFARGIWLAAIGVAALASCSRQRVESVGAEAVDFVSLIARARPAVVAVRVSAASGLEELVSGGGGRTAVGSGFFVRQEGLVVTNFHVIENASAIEVVLFDGRRLPARLLGGEQKYDLALLKVEGEGNFPVLQLGDSTRIGVGAWVVAIGNPLGLTALASKGIISGKGRRLEELPSLGRVNVDFLQTDAVTDVGSSGGPLIDLQGRVVGINSAINARGRGIGFAIPVDLLKALLPHLERWGRLRPAQIGVSVEEVSWEQAERCGLDRARGVLISRVKENGPAAEAGLEPGDVITAIAGAPVEGLNDVGWRICTWLAGQPLVLSVVRGGRRLELTVLPRLREME